MGLGVVDGGIARNVEALGLKALGKVLCAVHYGLLVFRLELVHFVCCHQQAQLAAKVMVGYAAGECAGLDGLPQAVLQLVLFVVYADNAALRAEEGLMGGTGDDLCALFKGFLEGIANETQYVSHVVHDGGGDVLLVHKLAYGGNRLFVQYHALAEDDELGAVLFDNLLGFLNVYLVDVVRAYGEVYNGMALGYGINGDVVLQCAHGLSGKVAALDDVVVENVAEALCIVLAVKAVLPVHKGREGGGVGHLAADNSGLYLAAAKIAAHLLYQHLLNLVYELGALIVEYIAVVESLYLLMLGIAEGGVGCAQHLHRTAGGVFGGDKVYAALLTPAMVFQRLGEQGDGLGGVVVNYNCLLLFGGTIQQGTGVGGSHYAHMHCGDNCLKALAAHVYLYDIILEGIAVDVAQADGALCGLIKYYGLKAFALCHVIGNHGAAGCPANLLVTLVDGHAAAHYALVKESDGHYPAGESGKVREVAVVYALKGLILNGQMLAAYVIALLGGKAYGEAGKGHCEYGHVVSVGVNSHLVAVEGHACLKAQGIAGAKACGLCAQLDKTVPHPLGIFALDEYLIAQRLAGVAGFGDEHLAAFHGEGVEGVLYGLGKGNSPCKLGEHILALGALNGYGGIVGGDVGDGAVVILKVLVQVSKVLIGVGGVHHQQQVIFVEAIEVCVIHGGAVLIGDDAVLGHVQIQCVYVAGKHMLQESHPVGACDYKAAHVGYVKEAACVAGIQMLGHYAGGVLDGHFPSAEIHHCGSGVYVYVVKLGAFKFAHSCPPVRFYIFRLLKAMQVCLGVIPKRHKLPPRRKICASVYLA